MGVTRLALRAGGRFRVRRVSGSGDGSGRFRPQAARGMHGLTWAIAVRVVMLRPALGKAWRVLVLRSRCRLRSMTMRRLPRACRVARCKAAVMGAGRLAVAAPDRMLAATARRAAVNEIWRGWTG